ncbi:MAG: DUF2249 domain-containing protein [Actinomycetia bacterium]|nr:DUF2249 domain-containing protein [Actinomycetes bacterium]
MSNEETIAAVHAHHGRMAADVQRLSEQVRDGARRGYARTAGQALVAWCRDELLPHALAEESTLYAAGAGLPATALLVSAMTADHRAIQAAVERLAQAQDAVDLAAAAAVVESSFLVHLTKENDQLLPALDAAGVDLAPLVGGMEELLGGDDDAHRHDHVHGRTDGPCACHHAHPAHGGPPASVRVTAEIHPQTLPPAVRHETILATVDALGPGEGLVLVAGHDPRPVGAQIHDRWPGAFTWTYLEDGPSSWRVLVARA